VAPLYEILDRAYGSICRQFWQADQYEHIEHDYGSSLQLGRDAEDLKHPDRPEGIHDFMRTEFQKNARLFSPTPVRYLFTTQKNGVKAKWLKGEVAHKIQWYLKNIKAAADHPDLKLTMKGFELFENPDALENIPDDERISLALEIEIEGSEDRERNKTITCSFHDREGRELANRSLKIAITMDPYKTKDRHYIGLIALHYLAMTEDDKKTAQQVNSISFESKTVQVKDVLSFSMNEDKGPDSDYPNLQAFRNKMARYHPAFV